MPSISGCPSRITNTTAVNRFFPQNLGDFFQRRFLLAAEEKRNLRRPIEDTIGTLVHYACAAFLMREGRSRTIMKANAARKLKNSPRIGQSDLFMPSFTASL